MEQVLGKRVRASGASGQEDTLDKNSRVCADTVELRGCFVSQQAKLFLTHQLLHNVDFMFSDLKFKFIFSISCSCGPRSSSYPVCGSVTPVRTVRSELMWFC